MAEGNTQFRGATFGGFHRQDVMAYLTSTANEHERVVAAFQAELEQVKGIVEEQHQRIEELEAKLAATEASSLALKSALDEAEADRAQTADRLLSCETSLHDVRKEANEAIEALRNEVRTLEPKAQAYDKIKERSAGIELDAHRRAQSTLDDAEQDALRLRQEQARCLREAQLRYELLRAGMQESFERSRAELDEVCQSFERVTREFDSHEGTLADLLAQAEEGLDTDSLKKLASFLL